MIRDTLLVCILAIPVFVTTAVAQESSKRGAIAISDDVVKIGVLNDMSSLYSDGTGKGSLTAAQMAVADFGGSVKGRPIEVISADHLNKPDVGSMIARTWYDTTKVDAIVGRSNFLGCAGGTADYEGKESRVSNLRRRSVGPHRASLLAERNSLDL
jgi:hypothetical protein